MRMQAIYRYCLIIILFSGISPLHAQNEILAKADKYYNNGIYPEAAALYIDHLEQQYDYIVNVKLADCYYRMEEWSEAEHWYGVIVSHNIADAGTLLRYATLLKMNGKYRSAKTYFLKYAAYKPDGYYLASTCDWALANMNKPSQYYIDTLPFNTKGSEMTPTIYKNGIIFAKSNGTKINNNTGLPYYDLYSADVRTDGSWITNKLDHVNSPYHDAAPFYDGASKGLYFTRSNHYKNRTVVSIDGQVRLELFYAPYVDSKFGTPHPLNVNSKIYSVGHPATTPDGNILIFASDKQGGKGGTDLYYCMKRNGNWSEPKSMGDVINTAGDELYPFMTADGTLYFASNYHPGFGGFDLFKCEREGDHWSTPENLGMPVNSPQDDYGFTMKNGVGYFSSNRPGGMGGDDIYQVTQMAQIASVFVYDNNKNAIYKARVTFFESPNSQVICETDPNGYGDVSTLSGVSTSIKISKEGYLDKVINNLGGLRSSNGVLPVELTPLIGGNE
ncbi:MAG TPA: hypothetical protein PLT99_02220 [Chitinophagales bacterium]|nr:hypothetical protein [Chitinophagales bacterium]